MHTSLSKKLTLGAFLLLSSPLLGCGQEGSPTVEPEPNAPNASPLERTEGRHGFIEIFREEYLVDVPGMGQLLARAEGANADFQLESSPLTASSFLRGSQCEVVSEEGPCRFSRCLAPPRKPSVSAGRLSVAGGPATVTLEHAPETGDYRLSLDPESERIFVGGETLRFTAEGAAFPAFFTEVRAPEPFVLEVPANLNAGDIEHDRTSDLSLRWKSTASSVIAEIRQVETPAAPQTPGAPNTVRVLSCSLPSSANGHDLPSTLARHFEAGPAYMRLAAFETAEVASGADRVTVWVGRAPTTPEGYNNGWGDLLLK